MRIKNVKVNIVPTKSSTYFLPILNSIVNFKFLNLLQNSYVMNNKEEGAFSVLYKWSGKQEFTKYEEELMKHHLFVGHEDYGEYVLYKFKLPKNAQNILKLFIAGKYSEYPYESKIAIYDFLKARGFMNSDKIYKILNKDEGLRIQMEKELGAPIPKGNELSSIPDMDSENFENSVQWLNIDNTTEF